jgi:hypothetical protein
MANKTKATSQKEEAREKGPETPDAPLLLLDLSGAAVKKMIKQGITPGFRYFLMAEAFAALSLDRSDALRPPKARSALPT